jgi:hypothetical protein
VGVWTGSGSEEAARAFRNGLGDDGDADGDCLVQALLCFSSTERETRALPDSRTLSFHRVALLAAGRRRHVPQGDGDGDAPS